jgi:hypothetical protein
MLAEIFLLRLEAMARTSKEPVAAAVMTSSGAPNSQVPAPQRPAAPQRGDIQ